MNYFASISVCITSNYSLSISRPHTLSKYSVNLSPYLLCSMEMLFYHNFSSISRPRRPILSKYSANLSPSYLLCSLETFFYHKQFIFHLSPTYSFQVLCISFSLSFMLFGNFLLSHKHSLIIELSLSISIRWFYIPQHFHQLHFHLDLFSSLCSSLTLCGNVSPLSGLIPEHENFPLT